MALFISPGGSMRSVFPLSLLDGFTFEELYELIGCDTIEILEMADGQRMVVDEDGRVKGLEPNLRATVFFQEGRGTGFAILGNVVLCLPTELK